MNVDKSNPFPNPFFDSYRGHLRSIFGRTRKACASVCVYESRRFKIIVVNKRQTKKKKFTVILGITWVLI